MQQGTITDEDRKFVETWENIAVGRHSIIRLDARGDEKHELIQGPRTFMVTTEERLINHDRFSTKTDPFLNGSFRPVVVPDSVTIESNPNALSEAQIVKILGSSELAWEEWMKSIDSPATLIRMMDLAEGADVSLKRYKEIERRLAEVRPQRRIQSTDPLVQNFLGQGDQKGGTGANTATDGAGNPRRQGGMSSNYR